MRACCARAPRRRRGARPLARRARSRRYARAGCRCQLPGPAITRSASPSARAASCSARCAHAIELAVGRAEAHRPRAQRSRRRTPAGRRGRTDHRADPFALEDHVGRGLHRPVAGDRGRDASAPTAAAPWSARAHRRARRTPASSGWRRRRSRLSSSRTRRARSISDSTQKASAGARISASQRAFRVQAERQVADHEQQDHLRGDHDERRQQLADDHLGLSWPSSAGGPTCPSRARRRTCVRRTPARRTRTSR